MSNLLQNVALVSQTNAVPFSEISTVAAALAKQASRDFGPIWGVNSTVQAFDALEKVPVDYWPVIILDHLDDPTAGGYHQTKDGEPFSVVLASEFPLAASHETLEMLADPFGNRKIAGSPPVGAPAPVSGFDRVTYLVEVCDPCEADQFAYEVNGVKVSDFITPHYYDPTVAAGVRYSFSGAIKKPHEVLEGGYVSFGNPVNGHWYQIVVESGVENLRDLGALNLSGRSVREAIDDLDRKARNKQGKKKPATRAMAAAAGYEASSKGRAKAYREAIEKL
ncbi:MAG TPA: hypothetical protein VKB79_24120 [Bryobacteraceae bacterium]|nr:hypothetical protein [Bryobacteraceae bacterium]